MLISDKNCWEAYAEGLHIEDTEYIKDKIKLQKYRSDVPALREILIKEGYIHLNKVFEDPEMDLMASVVQKLGVDNLPTPFAFIYDEFWIAFMQCHSVIKELFGRDYLRLPDFWAWFINPQKSSSGWKPHRDKDYRTLSPEGYPKSLTVWIPLTDATPLNGCIYVLPANKDKVYGTKDDFKWEIDLQSIRALPANSGDLLCWTQALLHWGSASSDRALMPRISIACEFQLESEQPLNEPILKPFEIPSLDLRFKLISKQILQYQHMYPLSDEHKAFAINTMSR